MQPVIDNIRIENFKIFRDLDLTLKPLTILTGFNSGGKSTVIQALLLSALACKSVEIPINGPFGLALGEAFDVLNANASELEIRFTLMRDSDEARLSLKVPSDRAVILTGEVASRTTGGISFDLNIGTYLSAERLGPRDLLEVPPNGETVTNVGEQGQFTAHVLAQFDRLKIHPNLIHPKSEASITLGGQVEAWLSDVVRPMRVQATWLPSTSAAMIRFRNAPSNTEAVLTQKKTDLPAPTDWMKPSNVGFGFSYALPIIVAGLTAQAGSILLIENPEAHLHPAGQSNMGTFLALVASSGIQVIVETHSEHIVNGIRLAIAENDKINSELAVFHFFGDTGMSTMSVSPSGVMSDWPPGFFDQAEADLAQLSRMKRGL
jgi:predicted ATPase